MKCFSIAGNIQQKSLEGKHVQNMNNKQLNNSIKEDLIDWKLKGLDFANMAQNT